MHKSVFAAAVLSMFLVGGAFYMVSVPSDLKGKNSVAPIAEMRDGKQFIDITAKGGYSPKVVLAKAGVPTVLRVITEGTFDCSASVVIPKLSYQKILQPTATTDIEISAEQAQGTLQGLCSMGMYGFKIQFQ